MVSPPSFLLGASLVLDAATTWSPEPPTPTLSLSLTLTLTLPTDHLPPTLSHPKPNPMQSQASP